MPYLDEFRIGDTDLGFALTSKHNEDDVVDIMSMRYYNLNMEGLLEEVSKVASWGTNYGEDESIVPTASIPFVVDVIKSIIVQHTMETLSNMKENLEFERKWKAEHPDE